MKPVLMEPPEPAAESFVVVRHADGGEESWWFAAEQLGLAAGANRFWCSDWRDCWKRCPDPTDGGTVECICTPASHGGFWCAGNHDIHPHVPDDLGVARQLEMDATAASADSA